MIKIYNTPYNNTPINKKLIALNEGLFVSVYQAVIVLGMVDGKHLYLERCENCFGDRYHRGIKLSDAKAI